jgi:RimJ/RimL family protein N-acetyltransferase
MTKFEGVTTMLNQHAMLALARERQEMFLAEAQAARQAKMARMWRRAATAASRRRPAAEGTQVVLRDGSEVLIRQVHPTDAPLLADGFARLGAGSRWLRFMTAKSALTQTELRYFTEVDHHDHEALGALDHAGGRGVGVARYIRLAEDPQTAEIAVTIIDDWQRRGLGTELLAQLSDRARQEGICRFTALTMASNAAVAGLLRNAGAGLVHRESDTHEYEIILDRSAA